MSTTQNMDDDSSEYYDQFAPTGSMFDDDNASQVTDDCTMDTYIKQGIAYKKQRTAEPETTTAILTHIAAAEIFFVSEKSLDFRYDNGDWCQWWAFSGGSWRKDDKSIRIRRAIATVLTKHLEDTTPVKIQQKNVILAQKHVLFEWGRTGRFPGSVGT